MVFCEKLINNQKKQPIKLILFHHVQGDRGHRCLLLLSNIRNGVSHSTRSTIIIQQVRSHDVHNGLVVDETWLRLKCRSYKSLTRGCLCNSTSGSLLSSCSVCDNACFKLLRKSRYVLRPPRCDNDGGMPMTSQDDFFFFTIDSGCSSMNCNVCPLLLLGIENDEERSPHRSMR